MKRRAVIFDRDGTMIDFVRDEELGAVVSAFHPSQVRVLPGVVEGLDMLRTKYVLLMATNQPGPSKLQCTESSVIYTCDNIVQRLMMDGYEYCSHHPDDKCGCRKPRPGMLLRMAEVHDLDLSESWAVGDTYVDVEAGKAAGMRTALLVSPGRCEFCPLVGHLDKPQPDVTGANMVEIAKKILAFPRV